MKNLFSDEKKYYIRIDKRFSGEVPNTFYPKMEFVYNEITGLWNPEFEIFDSVYRASKYLKEDYIEVDAMLQLCTIFDKKGDGSKYNDIELPKKLDYVPITDERFNTLEKCYAYLEEIYTKQWSDILIKKNYFESTEKDDVESIRLSNGGKFYKNQYNNYNKMLRGKELIPTINEICRIIKLYYIHYF